MNLQQIHDLAAQRSYYSRADNEVYQAISSGAKKVYLWTAREFRNYFIKTDTTTIVTAAGTQEYLCPPDLSVLIRIGEQYQNSPPNTPWRWMRPSDFNDRIFITREFASLFINPFTPASEFVYSGPYLTQASAKQQQGANPQGAKSISLAPIPYDVRNVKIQYSAQFLEITNQNSVLMMPMESHEAILDFAVAELLQANGDALSASYSESGEKKFQEDFLPFYRMQQIQQVPRTQEPYLDDLD